MSSPTALPPTALPPTALPPSGPAAAAGPGRGLPPALARGALLVVPMPIAAAAAATGALARLPWPVPVGAAAVSWSALAALGPLGRAVARTDGPAAAGRLVLAGFATLAGAGAAGLALLPGSAVGHRPAAYLVGLAALGYAAAVTAGVATGTEPVTLRWCLPALLTATAAAAGAAPPGAAGPLLAGTLALPLARTAGLARPPRTPARHRGGRALPDPYRTRAHRDRARSRRPAGRRLPRTGAPVLRHAGAHLLLGAGQATAVIVVWRAALPTGGAAAALLPVAVAVPAGQVYVAWQLSRLTGMVTAGSGPVGRRRGPGVPLLPPLAAGVALAAAAPWVPAPRWAHPDPVGVALAVAGGVLLGGALVTGWLLAERGHPAVAAATTGVPVVAALAAAGFAGTPPDPPAVAATLAGGYGAALLLVTWKLPTPTSEVRR